MPRLRNLLRRNSHVDDNEGVDNAESPRTRRPIPGEYAENNEEGEETEPVRPKRSNKQTSVPRSSIIAEQLGPDGPSPDLSNLMPGEWADAVNQYQLQKTLKLSRAEGRRFRPDPHAMQEADELQKAILESKKAAKIQERQRRQALQEQEDNMEEELRRAMEESRRMAAEEERRRAQGIYTFQPSWSEGHQVSHQSNAIPDPPAPPTVSPRAIRLPERVPRIKPRRNLDNVSEDEEAPKTPSRQAPASTRTSRTRPRKNSDNDPEDEVLRGSSRRVPTSKRTSGTRKREISDSDSEDGMPKGSSRRAPAPKRTWRRQPRKSSDDSSDEEEAVSSTPKRTSRRRRQNSQEDDSGEGSTTPTPPRQAPSPKRTSRRPRRSTSDDEVEGGDGRPTPSRRAPTRKQIPRRPQQETVDKIPKDGETPVAAPRRPSRRQPRVSLDNITEEVEEETQAPSLALRRPPRRKPQNNLDAILEDAEGSPTTTLEQRARTTQSPNSGSDNEGSRYQNIITRTSFGSQNPSRAPQGSPSTEVVKYKEPPISMAKLKTLCEMAFPVDHQIERAIRNSRTTRGIEIVQRSEDALYNEQMAAALANSMADPNLEEAPDITETGLDEHPPFYHALKGKKISDPSKWTTSDYREGKPGYKKKIDKRVLEVMRAWRDLAAFYESEQQIDLTKTNQVKAKALTYTLDEPPAQADDTPTEVAQSVGDFARLPARQMPTEPNETANWVNRNVPQERRGQLTAMQNHATQVATVMQGQHRRPRAMEPHMRPISRLPIQPEPRQAPRRQPSGNSGRRSLL
ncbi:MAG: hypothetical protein LQ342_006706 [Letrouitia transgressa]|nr:MAG: hypothetical protein LQ342_006706 [Letrouitia transgressa]